MYVFLEPTLIYYKWNKKQQRSIVKSSSFSLTFLFSINNASLLPFFFVFQDLPLLVFSFFLSALWEKVGVFLWSLSFIGPLTSFILIFLSPFLFMVMCVLVFVFDWCCLLLQFQMLSFLCHRICMKCPFSRIWFRY